MIHLSLVKYVLVAAVRDRFLAAIALAICLSCCLSIFMGGAAVVEQQYFSIVFAASGLRLSAVFGLILFVVFYVRRSFESKDIDFLLSRPISRLEFVASYSLSFIVLALIMSVFQTIGLYVLSINFWSTGHWLWGVSVLTENMIVTGIAFFFSMYLSSAATAAIACGAFYVLSRILGSVLLAMDAGVGISGAGELSVVMDAISLVIPRLDLIAQSSWLIYGASDVFDFGIVIAQGIVFSLFVFCATSLDLIRRQF